MPSGPEALLLCRYFGFGTTQTPRPQDRVGKLAAERLLRDPPAARSIGAEFDALAPVRPNVAYSCPSDDGELLYAIFLYKGEPDVPVEASLSGCRFARNGRARAAMLSPRLGGRLERLVPLR